MSEVDFTDSTPESALAEANAAADEACRLRRTALAASQSAYAAEQRAWDMGDAVIASADTAARAALINRIYGDGRGPRMAQVDKAVRDKWGHRT